MQLATADQAFTNAKAGRDVVGMTAALVYRALERNTGSVGVASVPCVKIKAVNPQIAAISQVSCFLLQKREILSNLLVTNDFQFKLMIFL